MSNAQLLKDMLEACEQNDVRSQPTEDEITTMTFLYDECKKLQPTILTILNDLSETDCLTDAVDANEVLIEVFQKYHNIVVKRPPNSDLITPVSSATIVNGQSRASTMDELNEIFANGGNQSNPSNHTIHLTPLAPTQAKPLIETNGMSVE